MLKGLIKITLVLLAASIIGIFADQVLWPYFIERPLFIKYNLEQSPIYVTEKTETTIQENMALKNAVEKVQNTIASIETTTAKGTTVAETGLILTSDGLIVALSDMIPVGSSTVIAVGGEKTPFEILKRDKAANLALIKINLGNLATTSFFALDGLKLGERVFLLGTVSGKNFVNEGVVRSFDDKTIETSMIDKAEAQGSPVFDIEGNILGLATVAKDGRVIVIPVSQIKTFSGL